MAYKEKVPRRLFPWMVLGGALIGLVGGPPGAFLGLTVAGAAFWAAQRNRDAALGSLLPDPAPAPAYAVTVCFLVRNCHRGRDRGLVTFLDGWMLFEGRRTRFALRAVDLTDARPDAGDIEVVLKAERRSLIMKSFRRTFERRFYAWYRATELVEGEPTLPPLRI